VAESFLRYRDFLIWLEFEQTSGWWYRVSAGARGPRRPSEADRVTAERHGPYGDMTEAMKAAEREIDTRLGGPVN
jgi:hypothetical protein